MMNLIRKSLAIGARANWDVKSDLKDGNLIEVLPRYVTQECGEVWLLSRLSKIKIARVHVLFESLMKELEDVFK